MCSCMGASSSIDGLPLAAVAAAFSVMAHLPVAGMGLSAVQIVLSLNPVFSAGSVVFFGDALSRRLIKKPLIHGRDRSVFLWFTLMVSAVLYLSVLGIAPMDVYSSGYGVTWVFLLVVAAGVFLLMRGMRVGFVFVLYMASHAMGLVPGGNLFDSMTDGFLFFGVAGVILVPWLKAKLFTSSSLPKQAAL